MTPGQSLVSIVPVLYSFTTYLLLTHYRLCSAPAPPVVEVDSGGAMATAPDSEGPPGDDPPTVHIHEVCSECLLAQCSHQRRARARQICACTLCTFAQPSTCRIACQCVIALQRCVSWLDQSWLIHFVCAENNAPASKRQKVGKGLHLCVVLSC